MKTLLLFVVMMLVASAGFSQNIVVSNTHPSLSYSYNEDVSKTTCSKENNNKQCRRKERRANKKLKSKK
jgi:hypothetical protein